MIAAAPHLLVDHALDTWSALPGAFPTEVRAAYVQALRDPVPGEAVVDVTRQHPIVLASGLRAPLLGALVVLPDADAHKAANSHGCYAVAWCRLAASSRRRLYASRKAVATPAQASRVGAWCPAVIASTRSQAWARAAPSTRARATGRLYTSAATRVRASRSSDWSVWPSRRRCTAQYSNSAAPAAAGSKCPPVASRSTV